MGNSKKNRKVFGGFRDYAVFSTTLVCAGTLVTTCAFIGAWILSPLAGMVATVIFAAVIFLSARFAKSLLTVYTELEDEYGGEVN